jgi:hypothetical protein|tara:strand:+ start:716 stop:1306 length:591 start_codon:yes stop_codon:yes gene_type:complete
MQRVGRVDQAMEALKAKLSQLKQQTGDVVQNAEQTIIDQATQRASRAKAQQVSNVASGFNKKVDQGGQEILSVLANLLGTTPADVKQRIQREGLDTVTQDAATNMARPRSFNTAYQAVNEAVANDPMVRRLGGPLAAASGVAAGTGALMEWNDPERGFAIVAGPNVNEQSMQDIIAFLENGDPLRREEAIPDSQSV